MEQFVNVLKTIDADKTEALKQAFKKEYDYYMGYVNSSLRLFNGDIENFKNSGNLYLSSIYGYKKGIEMANDVAELYEQTFGEKINQ